MAKIIAAKNGTKREAIIKEASILFKEKGFSATSMREIAESLAVEAPSLYNHINSKKELLQEICFKVANLFTAKITEAEISNSPVIEKLELIIRFHIHMMLQLYESVYIAEHEWKHLPEPYLSNFKNQRKSYRGRLAVIIRNGIEKKELRRVDPYVAVLTTLSAIGGIESWQHSKKNIDANSLEEDMVTILLQGLRNQDANQSIPGPSRSVKSRIINIKS
jgi:AcrR family transcriptional regulator